MASKRFWKGRSCTAPDSDRKLGRPAGRDDGYFDALRCDGSAFASPAFAVPVFAGWNLPASRRCQGFCGPSPPKSLRGLASSVLSPVDAANLCPGRDVLSNFFWNGLSPDFLNGRPEPPPGFDRKAGRPDDPKAGLPDAAGRNGERNAGRSVPSVPFWGTPCASPVGFAGRNFFGSNLPAADLSGNLRGFFSLEKFPDGLCALSSRSGLRSACIRFSERAG